jgi:hypothetical protein
VTKQCASFVWKSIDSDRVNFTIYYETLCADCRQFIITQVWFAYQAVADIVNLTFIPYGNAHEVYRPETKLYQFYCQHGADECYGNLIHVCINVCQDNFIVSIFIDMCHRVLSRHSTTYGKN